MFGGEREHVGQESIPKKRLSEMFTVHSLGSNNDIYSKKKITKYPSLGFFPFPLLLVLNCPSMIESWLGLCGRAALTYEVSNTERHLLNRGILKGYNVPKSPLVMLIPTSLLSKCTAKPILWL